MDKRLILIGGGILLYWIATRANASINRDAVQFDHFYGSISDPQESSDEVVYSYPSTQQGIDMGNLTRGERNNNPGNIVKSSSKWKGLAADQSGDSRFAVFSTPEYGIRALGVLLQNYQSKGYDTIARIITRYAPSSENDTRAYIQSVSNQTGIDPNALLDLSDRDTLYRLISAIITHENGRNIYVDNGALYRGVTMLA